MPNGTIKGRYGRPLRAASELLVLRVPATAALKQH